MFRLPLAAFVAALSAVAFLQLDPAASAAVQKQKGKDKKGKGPPPPDGVVAPVDDGKRVTPVFDPGAHTQAILAMGFNKDASRLITVGRDYTVQVWGTATGERLDILRLPGYGREKGFDTGTWNVAAVSADGNRVLIGGEVKYLNDLEGKERAPCRLLIVDIAKRAVAHVQIRTGLNRPVTAVGFAPDGETLALSVEVGPKLDPILLLAGNVSKRLAAASPLFRTNDCEQVALPTAVTAMSFSPDGKKLLTAGATGPVQVWDVPAGGVPTPKKAAASADLKGITTCLAWAPDGKRFVRTVTGVLLTNRRVELWESDGAVLKISKSWAPADLAAEMSPTYQPYSVQFLGPDTVYVAGTGPLSRVRKSEGTIAVALDISTGTAKRFTGEAEGLLTAARGAAADDGKLVACTVNGNTEVLIGKPGGDDPPVRCGNKAPVPYHVSWAKDPTAPGFAWTDLHAARAETKPGLPVETVRYAFDLGKVRPVAAPTSDAYIPPYSKVGDWELSFPTPTVPGAVLKRGDDVVVDFKGRIRAGRGHTLVPNGDRLPLFAFWDGLNTGVGTLRLTKADGTTVAQLLPTPTTVNSVAASPDGRFLIATTGTHRLNVYRTDGSVFPLVSFAQLNGEWVAWTPEGYFAASPGGEKLFGWAVHHGPNALVEFHPAEKYAKHYRRPDVIRVAIEKGSVAAALTALNAPPPPDLDKLLPPEVTLTLIEQRGGVVKVKAEASSSAKQSPVLALRVLLDGRPLPNGAGVWNPDGPQPATGEFEVEIPGGLHELKALARTADGSSVSPAVSVRGPKADGVQPTLYRVCVGVNEYDVTDLRLRSATKDAAALYEALEKHCVGPDNRFGRAKGELLLDRNATAPRVIQAVKAVRQAAKPGDLVVLFFAGHGVKQEAVNPDTKKPEDEFYLLTRESDPSKPLKGAAVSGADLTPLLEEMECPVLFVLDACHSQSSLKHFRPATDAATTAATGKGVTVMSAAMSHETAGATTENGYFTAGLLKGLAAGPGVPFDPYEKQMYVHHLYSVAFSEVRRASGGKQNPFLNMPWTMSPLPLRDVPVR